MAEFSRPSCLICSVLLDEQKPLLPTSDNTDNTQQGIQDVVSEFKRSFHCFCKLLNISRNDVVETILDQAFTAYNEGCELSKEKKFSAVFGLPCCGECCGALDEVVRLQQAIDEMKMAQMDRANVLKTSLLATNDSIMDNDTWFRIRQQLIACMLHDPISLHSQPPTNPGSNSNSSRTLPNILRRKSGRNSILPANRTNVGATGIHPTSVEYILPNVSNIISSTAPQDVTCSVEMPVLSPISPCSLSAPASPSFNQIQSKKRKFIGEVKSGDSNRRRKTIATSKDEKQAIDMGLVRPCSVVLERHPSQSPQQKEKNKFEEKNSCFPSSKWSDRKSKLSTTEVTFRQSGKDCALPSSSVPFKKLQYFNYGSLFYLVDETTLLCQYTLIKVSRGGTQLACMEKHCSTVFRNPDCYALFESMKTHVESKHMMKTNNKNNSGAAGSRMCPFPFCQTTFPIKNRNNYRPHLFSEHDVEQVICESCWKPMRHVADNYRRHKWFHKSKKEQLETEGGPPRQMVYKAAKRKEMKRKEQLKKFKRVYVRVVEDDNNFPKDQKVKDASTSMKKIADFSTAADLGTNNQQLLKQEGCSPEQELKPNCYKNTLDDPAPTLRTRLRTRSTKGQMQRIEESDDGDDDIDNQCDGNLDDADDDDFVPLQEASEHDHSSDDEQEFIPIKCPSTKKSTTKEIVLHAQAVKQTGNRSGKGSKPRPNDKFWKVKEDILLYKFTLIQISHGSTHLACLETNCGIVFQSLDYSTLFENMRQHINSNHLPVTENQDIVLEDLLRSSKHCPFSSCQADCVEFREGIQLRIHLFTVHSLETVICEICLKPIRDVGDNYSRHKWYHRNDQEKMEVPPPKQVVYKAKISKTGSKSRKRLEKLGIKVDGNINTVAAPPEPKIKRKNEQVKETLLPTKRLGEPIGRCTKDDVFLKIQEDLLLYKYTFIRVIPGQGFFCEEPGCPTKNTMVAPGSDYMAFETVKEHVETHHVKTSYTKLPRHCPLCPDGNNVFSSGMNFRNHFLVSAPEGHCSTSRYVCQICWKPMKTKNNLLQHMWSHKSEEEKSVCDDDRPKLTQKKPKVCICSTCGREFNQISLLRAHEPVHLPKELRKQFDCPHCSDKFLSAVAVRNHVERIHKPDLRRFRYCPICSHKFNHRDGYRLTLHLRAHKNERPFVCETCGTAFAASNLLQKHIKNVHVETRIFQCEFCEMSYKHRSNLTRHWKTVHKDKVVGNVKSREEVLKTISYEYRPDFIGPKIAFPCQFCDKVFQLKSRMTKHVKLSHANEATFIKNE